MAYLDRTYTRDELPKDAFGAVPAGRYPVRITKSDFKDTKSGSGKLWYFNYEILDGKYKGYSVYDQLNWVNQSEQATRIGHAQLDKICGAINLNTFQATEDFIGGLMEIAVSVETSDDGKERNRVESYTALQAPAQPQYQAPTQPAQSAQPVQNAQPQGQTQFTPPPVKPWGN